MKTGGTGSFQSWKRSLTSSTATYLGQEASIPSIDIHDVKQLSRTLKEGKDAEHDQQSHGTASSTSSPKSSVDEADLFPVSSSVLSPLAGLTQDSTQLDGQTSTIIPSPVHRSRKLEK